MGLVYKFPLTPSTHNHLNKNQTRFNLVSKVLKTIAALNLENST